MKIPTEPIPLEHLMDACTSDPATVARLVSEWFDARNIWEEWRPCEALFAPSRMPGTPNNAPGARWLPPALNERLETVKQAHINAIVASSRTLEEAASRLDVNVATIYRRKRKDDAL